MPPAHPLRYCLGWGVSLLPHPHLRDRVVSFVRTESWDEKGVGEYRPQILSNLGPTRAATFLRRHLGGKKLPHGKPLNLGTGAGTSLLETATKKV